MTSPSRRHRPQTPQPRLAGAEALPIEAAPVTTFAPAAVVRRATRATVSVETVTWLGLLLLAGFTRFYELGAKALHHDESLHAYYSYQYATGNGYIHDPLMHGPLLFHLNALVYLLFGASDATSRLAPAVFGIGIVGLPYLLRGERFLGRWGALAASGLLLISPTIMYQSRYIRHDVYTVFGALLLFACIVRFIDRPERRWLVTAGVTLAALFANHEIIFAIVLIFVAFLYIALGVERLRRWWPEQRNLVAAIVGLHIAAVLALGVLLLATPARYMDRLLAIPWDRDGTDSPIASRSNQVDYYRDMLSNPLVIGGVLVAVGFLIGLATLLGRVRHEQTPGAWLDGWTTDAEPRSVTAGIRAFVADREGLTIAAGLFLAVFVGLFTTLFTHWYGIFTATVATDGTLLYWLGQHDVQRGDQPWFYYILLIPQYEFIPVVFGVGMAILVGVRVLASLLGRSLADERLFFRAFLAFWLLGILAILSWAGEKMPWLIVHISLPAILLAACVLGSAAEKAARLRNGRRLNHGDALIAGGIALAMASWFVLAARLTLGEFRGDCANGRAGCRSITADDSDRWWMLALPFVAVALIVAAGVWLRGARRTTLTALFTVVAVLALLQIQASWRLSFDNPDVPVEMMVYTQTSPDVKELTTELNLLTAELDGSGDSLILFQTGGTQDAVGWPMNWYLRDLDNAQAFGSSTVPEGRDAAVILLGSEASALAGNRATLANYTAIEYPLRWWFPEELYRDFAIAPELQPGRSAWTNEEEPHGPLDIIASAVDSSAMIFTAEGQQELFRLLVYRDLEDNLGQTSFKLYVRNDLVPLFNEIRY